MQNKSTSSLTNARRILEFLPEKTDIGGELLNTGDPVIADILLALALSNIAVAEEIRAIRLAPSEAEKIPTVNIELPYGLKEDISRYLRSRSGGGEMSFLSQRVMSLEMAVKTILEELGKGPSRRGFWESLLDKFF